MPLILPCQASNPPFLANRCFAKLPLLRSPSYSVASCRWRWSFSMLRRHLQIMHMHRIPHPAYHTMFMCWLFTMLCASFRCCFFGLVPVTSWLWGPVRLRPFVFFMDSFFFLAGFQVRWPYPRNHFYLCLLSCSLFCYAYDAIPTTCLSCLLYCWTKPLTHLVLANRWLAMLPLRATPLIALLVAGEDWSLFLVGTWRSFLVGTLFTCWDITISLI